MPPECWTLRKKVKTTPEDKDDPVELKLLADEYIEMAILTLEEAKKVWEDWNGKQLGGYGNILLSTKDQALYIRKVLNGLGGKTL